MADQPESITDKPASLYAGGTDERKGIKQANHLPIGGGGVAQQPHEPLPDCLQLPSGLIGAGKLKSSAATLDAIGYIATVGAGQQQQDAHIAPPQVGRDD